MTEYFLFNISNLQIRRKSRRIKPKYDFVFTIKNKGQIETGGCDENLAVSFASFSGKYILF